MAGRIPWNGYAWAVAAAAVATLAGLAMSPRFDLVNIAMAYLLAVVIIARRFSRGPVVLATVLCVAAFDLLFVPPHGALAVEDAQYLVTFSIMLAVGLVVSDLVETVRGRARAQAALEVEAETQRMRNVLLASISHDLRSPLAVLTGASSSLVEAGERLDPAERARIAQSIFEQANEMSGHIDKVLQMTRLDAGAIVLERDWASVAEIAGSVLQRLQARLSSHRLIVDLPDNLPLVRVDAALVEQALANLLDNAARHTPPGTVVRLSARAAGDELVVAVEDFGAGISEAALAHAFEKFHRGTAEGGARGMGLGLAICRSVIHLHRGRTWAERMQGGGTAFRFSLPLERPPQPPEEGPAA